VDSWATNTRSTTTTRLPGDSHGLRPSPPPPLPSPPLPALRSFNGACTFACCREGDEQVPMVLTSTNRNNPCSLLVGTVASACKEEEEEDK
jgi:hypothetical protein